MSALATALLVISLLVGGSGGTVYASQSSMPDDLLYPVKTWSEDVRLQMTSDPQAQVELLESFNNRRIDEIVTLNQEGDAPPEAVLDRLNTHLDQSLQLVVDMDEDEIVPTLEGLRENLQLHEQTMQQLNIQDPQEDGALDQTRQMIQEQLQLVDCGLEEPLTLRERLSNPNEDVPDNVPGVLRDSDEDDDDDSDVPDDPDDEQDPEDVNEEDVVGADALEADMPGSGNQDNGQGGTSDDTVVGPATGSQLGGGQGSGKETPGIKPAGTSSTDQTPGQGSGGSGSSGEGGGGSAAEDEDGNDSGSGGSGNGGSGGGGGGGGK